MQRSQRRHHGTSTGFVAAALLLCLFAPCAAASTAPPARPRPAARATFEPLSASFVSASDGFVLGATRCTTASCAALVATSDGGSRWHAVAAPPAPLASPPLGGAVVAGDAISRILFSGTNGYSYGPGLWASTSASRPARWEQLHPRGAVLDLAVDAGTLWVVVASCWTQDPDCAAPTLRLEHAPVGTDAWQVVHGVGGFSSAQLLFRGSDGWVAMWPRRFPSPVSIWRTTDGGTSWSRLPDPCDRPAEAIDLAELASPGGSTLFELCAGNPGAGQEAKELLESTDGGASVRPVGDAPLGGLVEAFVALSPSLLVLAASSGAGFLYRSADGGRRWTSTTLDDGGAGLSNLAFVSPSVGFVVDGRPSASSLPDRLLMTRDTGRTWAAVPIAPGPPPPTPPPPSQRIGPSAIWRQATGGQTGIVEVCTDASSTSWGPTRACAASVVAHGASAAAGNSRSRQSVECGRWRDRVPSGNPSGSTTERTHMKEVGRC